MSISEQTSSISKISDVFSSDKGLNYLYRQLVRKKISRLQYGYMEIHDTWGKWDAGLNDEEEKVSIVIHNVNFYSYLFFQGSNGCADAYRKGLWSCSNLKLLFKILIKNTSQLDAFDSGLARLAVIKDYFQHLLRSNTKVGSKRNIHDHYDLGNNLFELFLDESMTYSSGIFNSDDCGLYRASINKLDLICKKISLKPEHHLIETGSGWGSFSIHAAKYYGCEVTTATISRQQYDLAKKRIQEAGLNDRIHIVLQDYRDLKGKYDCCVSIEMIEAVGDKYLPEYFKTCASLLRNDGQMCIQAITMPDYRYQNYLKTPDFIQRFIFPGSCVPSMSAIASAVSHSDLKIIHCEDYAFHYDQTLQKWLESFKRSEQKLYQLGYDSEFYRMWCYYLEYCMAGFSERYLGLQQIVLNKPDCKQELTFATQLGAN